jgi:ArsR family transcriptional regulator, arsenate/arsenite/antimonite-responsive transcriptional repressor
MRTAIIKFKFYFIFKKVFTFVRDITNYKMIIEKVITKKQEKAARYAKAMGHPVRMYILELLLNQSCCYSGDLSEELPIAKSTLSQHLKELKSAGLIQGEIEAPKIKYCLNRENWNEARMLFSEILKF